jgi:hypothetical protein
LGRSFNLQLSTSLQGENDQEKEASKVPGDDGTSLSLMGAFLGCPQQRSAPRREFSISNRDG